MQKLFNNDPVALFLSKIGHVTNRYMKKGTKVRYKRKLRNLDDELPLPTFRSRSIMMNRQPVILLFFFLIAVLIVPIGARNETRCGSIDIRTRKNGFNSDKLYSLNDSVTGGRVLSCTVIEGSFMLSMTRDDKEPFPKFEQLVEVTGSVMVFMAKGLTSLADVLPNLRVIGGETLIQHYALVIFRNDELEEINLPNLQLIRKGGVRITNNRLLCHSRSINWNYMITSKVNDVVIDDAVEASVTETAKVCKSTCVDNDPEENKCHYVNKDGHRIQSCWSETACQVYCPYNRIGPDPGPGCTADGEKCHDQCVAGCLRAGDPYACFACKSINYQGKCVDSCPPGLFSLFGRRCVTRETCYSLASYDGSQRKFLKAVEGKCTRKCPEGHEEDPKDPNLCRKCLFACQTVCTGNYTVSSYSLAQAVKDCHVIDGYLAVEVRASGVGDFADAFKNLHTITGYLRVSHTPTFMNLYMFKNLRKIEGRILFRTKYSISVYENGNLAKLFNPANKLKVLKGSIGFFNNHILCYKEIEKLIKDLGTTLSNEDQSLSSNGDKGICQDSVLDVWLHSVEQKSFILQWSPFNTTDLDHRKFLGYEVYYKKVDKIDPDLSIYDDRSACSDSWSSEFVAVTLSADKTEDSDGQPKEVYIDNLRPHTTYAYYVTTQIIHHDGARNAISKIGFVTTTFAEPSAPKVKIGDVTENSIEIEWDPPERPNGVIAYYEVSWREFREEISFHAESFCDENTVVQIQPDDSLPQAESISSTAPSLNSFIQKNGDQSTCSAVPGCCECAAGTAKPINAEETEEGAQFENTIQDMVFVRRLRKRRAIEAARDVEDEKKAKLDDHEKNTSTTTEPPTSTGIVRVPSRKSDKAVLRLPMKTAVNLLRQNVTSTRFVLPNLRHFTEYSITVSACQDPNVSVRFCSKGMNAALTTKTKPLDEADDIANKTIKFEISNSSASTVKVTWKAPENPNGGVKGYKVILTNVNSETAAHVACQPNIGNWTSENDGVTFKSLADGEYRVEIRAASLSGVAFGSFSQKMIEIYNPGFWTTGRMVGAIIIGLFSLGIVLGIAYYFVDKYYGKKVKEYATQLISANPEYLQNEVYKADDWELCRDTLEIEDEIGSGTFGKVFRGRGKDVLSKSGVEFGECAIKTVNDKANNAEKLHFLMEANVMKSFNSTFIVKLYGVVSDGQPVLCVMEMMALGNLRDYLRSRRPGADENTEGLSLPTKEQYHEWATQIADGMAYLESKKFCHRDLAARNCMVHADETVKIGDFGMARDLYYHEYYKPTGKRLMPVRWMAPESLKDGKFDSKSDCWSYGIVLYEILTLGQQPYQGLANDEVLNYIGMSRRVLEKPLECPDYWYKVMKMCWRYEPRDRPTFAQIVRILAPAASKSFHAASHVIRNGLGETLDGDAPIYAHEDLEDNISENDGSEEPLYVEGPVHKISTSIPMENLRSLSESQSQSSSSSSKEDSTSANSNKEELTPPLQPQITKTKSADRNLHDAAHGDYVERNVSDVEPLRISNGMIIDEDDYIGHGGLDNDAYCMSSRAGAGDHKGWSEESERLTNGHQRY